MGLDGAGARTERIIGQPAADDRWIGADRGWPPGSWARPQIENRMAALLLAGRLPPGERLPSTRALAGRLGVHRHTVAAAYRQLQKRGLVEMVRGRGAYARPRPTGPADGTARDLGRWLGALRSAGLSRERIAAGLGNWARRAARPEVAVLDEEPGTLRLLAHEVARALPGCRIVPRLAQDGPDGSRLRSGAPATVLVRSGAAERLPRAAGPWTERIVLPWVGGERLLAELERLPPLSVAAVVTVSESLRRTAGLHRSVLVRRESGLLLLRPPDVSVEEAVSTADARAWAESMRDRLAAADRVFVDALCAARLGELAAAPGWTTFPAVSPRILRGLRDYLRWDEHADDLGEGGPSGEPQGPGRESADE